ncbi:hypothetical protein FJZ36_16800 [Candidatus Poribacteria bacterium]|nr:hypothetical protein [Candidatus Poribacteria bacterium]
MPKSDLLRRMEALNGGPLQNLPEERPSEVEPTPRVVRPKRSEPPGSALDGIEIETSRGPAYYLIRRVFDLGDELCSLPQRFAYAVQSSGLRKRLTTVCRSVRIDLPDLIFLDLETCGLRHEPIFLVGAMEWTDGQLVVRQYLARHYAEEGAILAAWEEIARGRKALVTFNGKSFDVPYIRARQSAHGLPAFREPAHLDLLHESRRIWRRSVPNHRLQTLEERICGRTRTGDIPSSEIPAAYARFVRTGDDSEMGSILLHNALDLATLAELMVRAYPSATDD